MQEIFKKDLTVCFCFCQAGFLVTFCHQKVTERTNIMFFGRIISVPTLKDVPLCKHVCRRNDTQVIPYRNTWHCTCRKQPVCRSGSLHIVSVLLMKDVKKHTSEKSEVCFLYLFESSSLISLFITWGLPLPFVALMV